MKIGILTLPLHTNIGGILQAYALQSITECLGFSVAMFSPKPSFLSITKKQIRKIINFIKGVKKTRDQIDCENFVKTNFHNWFYFKEKNDGRLQEFNAVIVGSDQVWRSWGKKWNLNRYFLDFIRDPLIKKYAYAASFGFDKWHYSQSTTEQLKSLARKFTKISVRENDGIALCKNNLDVDAEWVLDPTMLLEKKDYEKLVQFHTPQNLGLVCYFIGENDNNKAFLQKALETTAHFFEDKWIFAKPKVYSVQNDDMPTIQNWLYNMLNASFVITNSFHGVAFSINFEKDFIVLPHESGGVSRIKSILSMFGLEDRLANTCDEISNLINKKIDWEKVSRIKTLQRNKSLDFIKNLKNK